MGVVISRLEYFGGYFLYFKAKVQKGVFDWYFFILA